MTLQEVDVYTMRSGQYLNQVKMLAVKAGMYYSFGKTIAYDGGDYGVAILSKFPIQEEHFYKLPHIEITEEQRGILVCKMDMGNSRSLSIATTHMSSSHEESRVVQAKRITEIQKALSFDLLTGDFNAILTSKPLNELSSVFSFDSRFDKQMTIPAYQSTKKIDFITKSKDSKVQIVRQDTYQMNALSDHNMIISDIVF